MGGDIVRPVPPYQQIADAIQADIASGKLREGDKIPSAREIQHTWGVAVATASRVQAELRARGLVTSVRGVGTVVRRESAGFSAQERVQSSLSRGRINHEPARIISASLVPAPPEIAGALGVDEGADVVRRERIALIDGVPAEHSVTWMPGRYGALAPEVLRPEPVPGGTFRLAAERAGQRVTEGVERVTAGAPPVHVAELLGVDLDAAVVLSRCWFRAADGSVVEYGEAVRIAGQWAQHSWTVEVG